MILAPFHECPIPNLGGLTLAGITFSRRGGPSWKWGKHAMSGIYVARG